MTAVALVETPVLFGCEGERLVGVVHAAPGQVGVVIVVGGPQYRAGSHRHFVQLARALAAAGYPVLRFDVRGMGDSTGELRSFEQITPDIAAAVDTFVVHQPQVERVVLWGLCDAAAAALLYVNDRSDPRIAGLCLANPWVRSAQTLAAVRVRHYYLKRLSQRDFWLKLLRGGVAVSASMELARAIGRSGSGTAPQASSFQQRMLAGWRAFNGPTLLLLSGDDLTAMEFKHHVQSQAAWSGAMTSASVHELAGADHTFSRQDTGARAIELTLGWLSRHGICPEPNGGEPTRSRRTAQP